MERRFEGRTFMVIGAGTGFGAELCVGAAQEGAARVLVHYRRSSAGAERTAERVREDGAEALIVQGDITSWADIKRAPQYAAGKYGLLGITKSYAKALAPEVRVNTFVPGFMETEAWLARPEWKAGRRELVREATPTGRIPAPEEMTGAALFLASDDAHHITGSYVIPDGGYSMLEA
jgi:3-oxoacyl-[acyl-carrier protein] reductase